MNRRKNMTVQAIDLIAGDRFKFHGINCMIKSTHYEPSTDRMVLIFKTKHDRYMGENSLLILCDYPFRIKRIK